MDNNEKLGLIERVDHASEDQAKRTLKYMILKCNVKQDTIARAIREAIDKHTPTPMIVYRQPESEDDDEEALQSSRKRSNKKQNDQDGSSEEDDDTPSAASNRRHSTRRGDINPDAHVGNLILENSKTKFKKNKKRSRDHDEEQEQPSAARKSKSKPASEPRAERRHRVCIDPKGTVSKQKSPPVIDLVTSSDDESSDTDQSSNEILDDKSSDENGSDNESPDDYSSESDSSDDGDSEEEVQGRRGALVVATLPSQDGCNKKANQANVRSGSGSRIAAQSVTFSMAKASNQNDSDKTRPSVLNKKRKEPTVGEIHDEIPAKSATDTHANKRSKQNHPQESQRSPEDRTCRKCGLLFPSVAQLLKHRLYCKNSIGPLGGHHRSEPPSDDRFRPLEKVQKASRPPGDNSTDEPQNTMQLPSRPRPSTPADRGLSVPPPSFVHEPNNFPRGPTPTPLALARSVSGIQSSPPGLVRRSVPKISGDVSPGRQPQLPRLESYREHRIQEYREKVVHQCKVCKKSFTEHGNAVGACKFHNGAYTTLIYNNRRTLSNCALGQYQLLTEKHLKPSNFRGRPVPSNPYEGWTCCRRRGKNAPPCITDRMHVRP